MSAVPGAGGVVLDAPCDSSLPLEEVWSSEYLKALYHVSKYNPDQKLAQLSKRERVWGIDFFMRSFAQLPVGATAAEMWALHSSDKAKVLVHSSLYRVEKDCNDEKRLRLRFFKAEHPYELVFQSGADRQRFYECAKALRQYVTWCPALVPFEKRPSAAHTMIELAGNTEVPAIGGTPEEKHTLQGIAKLKVTACPTEDIRVWTGSKDLKGSMPGRNDLDGWIPRNAADFYVTAFQDIPQGLQQNTVIGELVTQHLGSDYVPLLSTLLESGKRSVAMTVVCSKTKALKVSNTGAWTGYVTRSVAANRANLTLKQKMGMAKGRVDAVQNDMVALQFSVNETSLLFVSTKLKVLQEDEGELAVQVRNEMLKDLLSKLSVGPADAGDASQKFHHTFVMGCLGYGCDVEAHDWRTRDALPRGCDRLSREIAEGRALYHFQEPPNHTLLPEIAEVNLEQRILYKAQAGESVHNVEGAYRTHAHRPRNVLNPCVSNVFVFPTLLTYLGTFGTPAPLRAIKILEAVFVCEKGRPGAWEAAGKPVPPKLTFVAYTEFAAGPSIRAALQPKADLSAFSVAEPMADIVPATMYREYLDRQYVWVSVLGEKEEVVASGVVLLGKILEHEKRGRVPVEVRLKKGAVFADCKVVVVFEVARDDAPVLAAQAAVEAREVPRRRDVREEEETAFAVILSLVQPSLDEAAERVAARLEEEREEAEGEEEEEREEIEDEEEEEWEALLQAAASVHAARRLNEVEQEKLLAGEAEGRLRAEAEEALRRAELAAHMAAASDAAAALVVAAAALAEEEAAARARAEAEAEHERRTITDEVEKFLQGSVELFEGVGRRRLEAEAAEEAEGFAAQAAQAWAALVAAERDAHLARLAALAAALQDDAEPAGREGVHREEAEAFAGLIDAPFRDGLRGILAERDEKARERRAAEEAAARAAAVEEEAEAWAAVVAAAAVEGAAARRVRDERLASLEVRRAEVATEEAEVREEIEDEQASFWRMLLVQEEGERLELGRNLRTREQRAELGGLVQDEHERGTLLFRDEQLAWEELLRAEASSRREHGRRVQRRHERERYAVETGEAGERRGVQSKEATRFLELLQAFDVELEASEKRVRLRLEKEERGRALLLQEEAALRDTLAAAERLARKDARRLTLSRTKRELEENLTLTLSEQAGRGAVEREQAQAFRLLGCHAPPAVERIGVQAAARGGDVTRALDEVPFAEVEGREAVVDEEAAAWVRLATEHPKELAASVEKGVAAQLLTESTTERADITDEEANAWEALNQQAFDEKRAKIQESLQRRTNARNLLQDLEFAEAEARSDLAVAAEGAAREGLLAAQAAALFDDAAPAEFAASLAALKAAETEARRAARRREEARVLAETELFWEEAGLREVLARRAEQALAAVLRLEGAGRAASVRAERPLPEGAAAVAAASSPLLPPPGSPFSAGEGDDAGEDKEEEEEEEEEGEEEVEGAEVGVKDVAWVTSIADLSAADGTQSSPSPVGPPLLSAPGFEEGSGEGGTREEEAAAPGTVGKEEGDGEGGEEGAGGGSVEPRSPLYIATTGGSESLFLVDADDTAADAAAAAAAAAVAASAGEGTGGDDADSHMLFHTPSLLDEGERLGLFSELSPEEAAQRRLEAERRLEEEKAIRDKVAQLDREMEALAPGYEFDVPYQYGDATTTAGASAAVLVAPPPPPPPSTPPQPPPLQQPDSFHSSVTGFYCDSPEGPVAALASLAAPPPHGSLCSACSGPLHDVAAPTRDAAVQKRPPRRDVNVQVTCDDDGPGERHSRSVGEDAPPPTPPPLDAVDVVVKTPTEEGAAQTDEHLFFDQYLAGEVRVCVEGDEDDDDGDGNACRRASVARRVVNRLKLRLRSLFAAEEDGRRHVAQHEEVLARETLAWGFHSVHDSLCDAHVRARAALHERSVRSAAAACRMAESPDEIHLPVFGSPARGGSLADTPETPLSARHGNGDDGKQAPAFLSQLYPLYCAVEAHTLVRAVELNGAHGTVVGYEGERVLVNFGSLQPIRGIRSEHLTLLPLGADVAVGGMRPPAPPTPQPQQQQRQLYYGEASTGAGAEETPPSGSGESAGMTEALRQLKESHDAEVRGAASLLRDEVARLRSMLDVERSRRLKAIEQASFKIERLRGALGRAFPCDGVVEDAAHSVGEVVGICADGCTAEVAYLGGDGRRQARASLASLRAPKAAALRRHFQARAKRELLKTGRVVQVEGEGVCAVVAGDGGGGGDGSGSVCVAPLTAATAGGGGGARRTVAVPLASVSLATEAALQQALPQRGGDGGAAAAAAAASAAAAAASSAAAQDREVARLQKLLTEAYAREARAGESAAAAAAAAAQPPLSPPTPLASAAASVSAAAAAKFPPPSRTRSSRRRADPTRRLPLGFGTSTGGSRAGSRPPSSLDADGEAGRPPSPNFDPSLDASLSRFE